MRTILLSLATILCMAYTAFAQGDAQAIYNSAVDQINCNTIKFIHNEAGRPNVAKEMSCYTFESIEKSIPLDETSTTGKLAKDIEAFKGKFDASITLDNELQEVINFAMQRVKAKPRKGDVKAFEEVLLSLKEEAVLNLASTETAADIAATDGTEADAETTEEEVVADNTGGIVLADEEEEDTADASWILWTAIIFSLIAIGISIYTLMMLQRIPAGGLTTNINRPAENTDNSAAITELVVRLRQTENRLNEEIRRLEDKIGSIPAAVVYPINEPSSVREYNPRGTLIAEEQEETKAEDKDTLEEKGEIISEIIEETPVEELEVRTEGTFKQEENEGFIADDAEQTEDAVQEGDMITEALQKEGMEIITEHEPLDETEEEVEEETAVAEEEFDGGYEEEESEIVSEPVRYEVPDEPNDEPTGEDEDALPSSPVVEDTDQEAETEPYYVYASLPEGDAFHENDLTESPDKESVFEIEMYEDVPNKAFISLLPYPELIRKMIAEPGKYLTPCCTYTGDPEGKRTIVLEEEGILRKEGSRWIVAEKAKVRFE